MGEGVANLVKKALIAAFSFIVFFSAFGYQPEATDASSKAESIIAEAKRHIGTPYQWGGTNPSGFDCSGYMNYVFKKSGVELPRTAAQQYGVGTPVAKANLQKGDLVFFTHGSGIQHNGLYIGNGKFIHSSTSHGVMISNINDPYYWKDRYVGAKRVL